MGRTKTKRQEELSNPSRTSVASGTNRSLSLHVGTLKVFLKKKKSKVFGSKGIPPLWANV